MTTFVFYATHAGNVVILADGTPRFVVPRQCARDFEVYPVLVPGMSGPEAISVVEDLFDNGLSTASVTAPYDLGLPSERAMDARLSGYIVDYVGCGGQRVISPSACGSTTSTGENPCSRLSLGLPLEGNFQGFPMRKTTLILATLASLVPAVASAQSMFDKMTFDELREYQVSRYLMTVVEKQSSDGAWFWDDMVRTCTRILMNGSPEQDRESSRVRLTSDAKYFLFQCAEKKGFAERP
jgi:hypothetical protein